MIKKTIVVAASIIAMSMSTVFATSSINAPTIIITPSITSSTPKKDVRPVLVREFFTQYCNAVGYGIPDVFRQIPLRIPGVKREEPLYIALQKCVYLGFVPNSAVNYLWDSKTTSKFANVFASKTLKIDPDINEDDLYLSREDFVRLIDTVPNYKMLMSLGNATQR